MTAGFYKRKMRCDEYHRNHEAISERYLSSRWPIHRNPAERPYRRWDKNHNVRLAPNSQPCQPLCELHPRILHHFCLASLPVLFAAQIAVVPDLGLCQSVSFRIRRFYTTLFSIKKQITGDPWNLAALDESPRISSHVSACA